MNERKKYIFWVGNIKYSGRILDENLTHWVILDQHYGKVDIPKTAVRIEVGGTE